MLFRQNLTAVHWYMDMQLGRRRERFKINQTQPILFHEKIQIARPYTDQLCKQIVYIIEFRKGDTREIT